VVGRSQDLLCFFTRMARLLIALIIAVIDAVTLYVAGQTHAVRALEQVVAVTTLLFTFPLIRVIPRAAVIVAITHKRDWNTQSTVAAKLIRSTGGGNYTALFIVAVATVVHPVTQLDLGNTAVRVLRLRTAALKLTRLTVVRAVKFVRTIRTIVYFVTYADVRDAAAIVLTQELIILAHTRAFLRTVLPLKLTAHTGAYIYGLVSALVDLGAGRVIDAFKATLTIIS
jgi:hypothetical protein